MLHMGISPNLELSVRHDNIAWIKGFDAHDFFDPLKQGWVEVDIHFVQQPADRVLILHRIKAPEVAVWFGHTSTKYPGSTESYWNQHQQ